jgi:hypothetical protein
VSFNLHSVFIKLSFLEMSNSNSQMITLLTEMTTSYERASLAERYRVLPFLLSTVNKILSRLSPRGGFDASSDTSQSASTLAAIQCSCSSLKGLTTVDLCDPPSTNTDNKQSSSAAGDETLGGRNDSNRSDSDRKKSHSDSSQNNNQKNNQNNSSSSSSSKESQERSDSTPFSFSEHLNSPAVTEGVEQFVRNKEAISRTIFLLTICMESVKNREMQNRMSQGNRSVVVYKESRSAHNNSSNDDSKDEDDDDNDDCQDNDNDGNDGEEDKQKHSNNTSTNNSTNNIDSQYPMRRQLNGDDDAIICTAFEALRTAQILWSLSEDVKKIQKIIKIEKASNKTSNKAVNIPLSESSNLSSNLPSNTVSSSTSNSSINQDNKDNSKMVESDKSIENKNENINENKIDNRSSFLRPFSSIFLAQLVQFSLFFGAQR